MSADSSVILLAVDLVDHDVCIEVQLLHARLDVAQVHAFLFPVLQWFRLNKSLLELTSFFLLLLLLLVILLTLQPQQKRCNC